MAVPEVSRKKIVYLWWNDCGEVLQRREIAVDTLVRLIDLRTDTSGTAILAVQTRPTELVLICLHPDGTPVWAKRYRANEPTTWLSLSVDGANNLIIGGHLEGQRQPHLLKVDPQGNIVWSRRAFHASFMGRADATPEGGAFQVSAEKEVLKWNGDGEVEWALRVNTTSPRGIVGIQPVRLSDGFVLAVQLAFDYLHLVKLNQQGDAEWVSISFPGDISVTGDLFFGIHPQRIAVLRGDSTVIMSYFSKDGAVYVSLNVLSPEGEVVFQNLIQPQPIMYVQDFSVGPKHLAGVGWNKEGLCLLHLNRGLTLGCGDFQRPSLLSPLILVYTAKEAPAATGEWPLEVSDFSLTLETLPLPVPTLFCIGNDSSAASVIVRQPTCIGEVVYLRPDVPGNAAITWPDGRQDTLWRAEGPGNYVAQIDYCGLQWDVEYQLEAQDCACTPIFPSAFTPDGDGHNDGFGPIASPECAYVAFEWSVFNRWGQRIFSAGSPYDTWDGRLFDGRQPAPSGVYVWQLHYALNHEGNTLWFVKKGDVTLLR